MATTTERPTAGAAAAPSRPGLRSAGDAVRRHGVIGSVLVVGAVLALLLAGQLSSQHRSLLGLIHFGGMFAAVTHPPSNAPVLSPMGYDGQFYWIQAQDPLLVHGATIADLARYHADFLQRLGYPLLAFILSFGQRSLLPAAMLAVNLLSVLLLTGATALWLRRRGASPWWALVVGLTPGLLMPVLRDLSDPLATAALGGALLAWESRRGWLAGLMLALAALTREPMIVGVAGVGAEVAARAWSLRRDRPALADLARRAAPALLIPVLLFGAWQAYIRLRYVPSPSAVGGASLAPTPVLSPFAVFLSQAHRALHEDLPIIAWWEISYMILLICALAMALALLGRGIRALTVTAVLLGAILPFVYFDDEWSLSRYGAPLLIFVFLSGVRTRSRPAIAVALAAAALLALVPATIAGT